MKHFVLYLLLVAQPLAAQTLAATAIDLLLKPELITRAKVELAERRGAGFKYEPLLGNRPPALDYRE